MLSITTRCLSEMIIKLELSQLSTFKRAFLEKPGSEKERGNDIDRMLTSVHPTPAN